MVSESTLIISIVGGGLCKHRFLGVPHKPYPKQKVQRQCGGANAERSWTRPHLLSW